MAGTVWKGHLSFGLISIPVRLSRAARPERINLRQLARAAPAAAEPAEARPPARGGNVVELPVTPAEELPVERVRRAAVTESGGPPIPAGELLKGFEYGKDQWVLLDKEDLKQITAASSKVIDVREFVRFSEIDPLYLESSYYVSAEKNGERAYALLHQALRETGYAALGDIAMHSREHVLIVRPGRKGLLAHTMYYVDEVRREEEYHADLSLVTPKELELAKVFIQTLAASFEPEKYKDAYRQRLAQLIDAKAQGRQLAPSATPEPPATPAGDLMEALRQSLAAAKKPPSRQEPPRPAKKRGV